MPLFLIGHGEEPRASGYEPGGGGVTRNLDGSNPVFLTEARRFMIAVGV